MHAQIFCTLTIVALFSSACSARSNLPSNTLPTPASAMDEQIATVIEALDSICVTSEQGQSTDMVAASAFAAGFMHQSDDTFRLNGVSVAPGGVGTSFCDIQIIGEFDKTQLLIEKIEPWATSFVTALHVIDAPAMFESGDDRGTRVVWGHGDIRLAIYAYDNQRADRRRVRIMYDAL